MINPRSGVEGSWGAQGEAARSGHSSKPIRIIEVGPRDGLQLESTILGVADRIDLILKLARCGLSNIEVASFVSERKVPQMAGADAIVASLPEQIRASAPVLVLNEKGTQRALDSGARRLRFVVAATEQFSQRNQGASIAECLSAFGRSVHASSSRNAECSAIIAVAFGCPFQGSVRPRVVVDLAEALVSLGAREITVADTIGVAVPNYVEEIVGELTQIHRSEPIGGHFHDTRNTGIVNCVAAIRAGAEHLDSSVGGLGGCPFAPNATGNVATEDLVYCLESMGIDTGVELAGVLEVANWLGSLLGRSLTSALLRAGIPNFLDSWATGSSPSSTAIVSLQMDA